jgi:hypothetical protein
MTNTERLKVCNFLLESLVNAQNKCCTLSSEGCIEAHREVVVAVSKTCAIAWQQFAPLKSVVRREGLAGTSPRYDAEASPYALAEP